MAIPQKDSWSLFVPPEPDCSSERECVLFIGTQFSILYTSMYSPAEAATRLHLGRREEQPPQTLLAAVSPKVGIVGLAAPSTLVTCTPPLPAAPGALLPSE